MSAPMLINRLFDTKLGIEYPEREVVESDLLEAAKFGVQGEFTVEQYGYKQVTGEYLNYWVRESWNGNMPWEEA